MEMFGIDELLVYEKLERGAEAGGRGRGDACA